MTREPVSKKPVCEHRVLTLTGLSYKIVRDEMAYRWACECGLTIRLYAAHELRPSAGLRVSVSVPEVPYMYPGPKRRLPVRLTGAVK